MECKRLLELFSGTGSIGKVAKEKGYEVVSLDKFLSCDIKVDILEWDYKIYPVGYFDVITASPVCLYWSLCRLSWIGRKIKAHGNKVITREIINEDIEKYGIPMVDKVIEIIRYFKPRFWWIENPQTGSMKNYINFLPFYDVDYCMYGFDYKKRTRIWTNILNFKNLKCKDNCNNGDFNENGNYKHNVTLGRDKNTTKLQRYRVPYKLINDLLDCVDETEKGLLCM
jgi:hypothetical protein